MPVDHAVKRTTSGVLFIDAPDQKGLTRKATEFLSRNEVTITDAAGAVMDDGYHGSFTFHGSEDAVLEIKRTCRKALPGFAANVKIIQSPRQDHCQVGELTVLARDREGILASLTATITRLDINIHTLSASRIWTEFCDDPLFVGHVTIVFPEHHDLRDVRKVLTEELAAVEDWAIDLREHDLGYRTKSTVHRLARRLAGVADAAGSRQRHILQ